MCREDILYYINAWGWVYEPRTATVHPFITWDFQDEFILDIQKHLNKDPMFIDKSRDMGVTWMIIYVLEHSWHFSKNKQSFLMVSRKELYVDSKNEDALFRKIDFIHSRLPAELLPPGRIKGDNDPNRTNCFLGNSKNGSKLNGESTNNDVARGGRQGTIFCDEFAAVKPKDSIAVLDSIRESTFCFILCSTPQGEEGGFAGMRDKPGMIKMRAHWIRHPRKSKGLYTIHKDGTLEVIDTEWHRRNPGYKFNMATEFPTEYRYRSPEYDRAVSMAFNMQSIASQWDIDYSGSMFQFISQDVINEHKRMNSKPPLHVGDFIVENGKAVWMENPKGKTKLWIPLDHYGRVVPSNYGMGCDVSMGTGASNSTISVGDKKLGIKVMEYVNSRIDVKTFARLCCAIGRFFTAGGESCAKMLPDANGATGKAFIQEVLSEGYDNLYYMRDETIPGGKWATNPGYYGKYERNEQLFEEYGSALKRNLFRNPSEVALNEVSEYKVENNRIFHMSSAAGLDPMDAGARHGDIVWADALCYMAIKKPVFIEDTEDNESDELQDILDWLSGGQRELVGDYY